MGYETAIAAGQKRLDALETVTVTQNTSASWDGARYLVPWFGVLTPLDSGNDMERILWLHYLSSSGAAQPSGEWIAYREAPGARFYEPAFNKRAVVALVKGFAAKPEALVETAARLGGVPFKMGDGGAVLFPFPEAPVAYAVWAGDDELPPGGQVLFDRTAAARFSAEDLAVLASLGAYKLLKYKNV